MRRRLRAAVTLSQLSSAACDPRPQAGAGRCNSPVSGGAPPAPRPRQDPRRAGVRLLQTRRVLNHGRHRPVGGARRRVDTVWVVITWGGFGWSRSGPGLLVTPQLSGHPQTKREPATRRWARGEQGGARAPRLRPEQLAARPWARGSAPRRLPRRLAHPGCA